MKRFMLQYLLVFAGISLIGAGMVQAGEAPDFTREKTCYVVPYAHLDTQYRWDFPETINVYLKRTLDENFPLMDRYPHYIFNFSGTWRYELMKEYYPDQWESLRKYVAAGRWHPAGAEVEETDSNIPSPESMIRNILYGNQWLRQEFGFENHDYILPDCFGFQASMPSVLAHCGINGFSTAKLTWGLPFPIPFNVGVWQGPDGKSVMAALNATKYDGGLEPDFANDTNWVARLEADGKRCGLFVDYRYFGVGDRGGACLEADLKRLESSLATPGKFRIAVGGSGRLFDEISPQQRAMLPRYEGDLLLKDHSAGTLTSQAFMKRCNRKGELLADAAERAGVLGQWLGVTPYPAPSLRAGWGRLIASQFHDILPGTSLPECYDYSYNDEFIALKGFAADLVDGVSAVASALKTDGCKGLPVVVFNPLGFDREDPVEIEAPGLADPAVFDASGKAVPCQKLAGGKVLAIVRVPSVGFAVLDVREGERHTLPSRGSASYKGGDGALPQCRTSFPTNGRELVRGGEDTRSPVGEARPTIITSNTLENARYKVSVNEDGDIARVFDKKLGRELLSAPAQVQFLYDNPKKYPAWNIDWEDQKNPPREILKGPATVRIVESGPARVALEIERSAHHSRFVQTLRLAAGEAGDRLEIATFVDWRGKERLVKQAFPLSASNPLATYNLGLGTIQRGNDDPGRYEAPSREWFDLTDASGAFGVTVLEDCKFGSDKPADNVLRLTLLRTPGVQSRSCLDQQWQDWGRHTMVYGLAGHAGDGRNGQSERMGRRLNQPLRAFVATRHDGPLGVASSLVRLNTEAVDIRAMKLAEDGQTVIIRLQNVTGANTAPVTLSFGNGVRDGWEVDGQEKRIGGIRVRWGTMRLGMFSRYALRSFAVVPRKVSQRVAPLVGAPCDLAPLFNADVMSTDKNRADGDFEGGHTLAAEQVPAQVRSGGLVFTLGSGLVDGVRNAVVCKGQKVILPRGAWNEVHLLVAADEDLTVRLNGIECFVPAWNKPVGNWDRRLWTGERGSEYKYTKTLVGLAAGYVKPGRIASFATHTHSRGANEAYQFSYMTQIVVPVADGPGQVMLPDNPKLKVFAVSAANRPTPTVVSAAPLYDDPGVFGAPAFDPRTVAAVTLEKEL